MAEIAIRERFWPKVARRGPGECWEWQAFRTKQGYGRIIWGREQLAHRVVWTMLFGPITGGMHILHRCDNPSCVNPLHLYEGTNADNVRDKVERGRSSFAHPERRGDRHPLAKLSTADVTAIRAYPTHRGSGKELAERFGVTKSTITHIRKRKIWKHV